MRFRKTFKALISAVLVVILAWAPWLTDDYAVTKVVEKVGGENTQFDYLGDKMPVRDVPKEVVRIPFGALIYFPGEALFVVTFFGLVL